MSVIISGTEGVTFNDASLQGAAASPYVLKNRIINGAMVIDQRNAGASVTITDTSANTYTLDRWLAYGSSASKFSVQQNAASVTPPTGFSNYLGVTSLATTTVGSSDRYYIGQFIEGFNTADLGFGTASASTVTLSFWVRSSLTGTFGGTLMNNANNRNYPFTYTISVANTWEQKSVTIAGDTTGTWVGGTNGIGIKVFFGLGVGSAASGTAGAWGAGNFNSATGATSVVGTNGATFYITGVQLEQNTVATPFERRLYNQELANCQRYYQKTYSQNLTPGTNLGDIRTQPSISSPASISGQALTLFCWLKTTMRTVPTIVYYDSAGTVSKITGIASNTGQTNGVSLNDVQISDSGIQFRAYDIAYYGFGLAFTASAEL
jgi:hypothetical protein